VVPANIYYHFYIGLNLSALQGARRAYDWVMRNPVAPVFVSEYVDVVRDFYYGRVARLDTGAWEIWTDGHLQTARFDGPPRDFDLDESAGVIGYVYEDDLQATYVHLLGPRATLVPANGPPKRPYVLRATPGITRAERRGKRLTLDVSGVGRKVLEIGGLTPERPVEVTVYRGPTVVDEPALAADAQGHVSILLEGAGPFTVDVGHP
jgi:hypothetical protein